MILARLALLVSLVGCTSVDEYAGGWRGEVVGDATPVFILRGFPEGTVLSLEEFSPPPADGPIGYITTTEYDAFDRTPLELIAPLEHDQLSLYDFPGGGRLKSYIFAARPTAGPIAGRDAMVFVSLMEYDKLEVRVIVGSGDESSGGHYGYFQLIRP